MDFDDFERLTEVFVELSAKPQSVSTDQLDSIEKYVCQVCYGDSSEPTDTKRMKDFEHSTHGNLKTFTTIKVRINGTRQTVCILCWMG